jgi:hypothetical protein
MLGLADGADVELRAVHSGSLAPRAILAQLILTMTCRTTV